MLSTIATAAVDDSGRVIVGCYCCLLVVHINDNGDEDEDGNDYGYDSNDDVATVVVVFNDCSLKC